MIISRDISNKIEQHVVAVVALITAVAGQASIPFFLIGAKARDLFFSAIFNIQTKRASLDVDLAIKVSSWDEVTKLVDSIISTGQVKRHQSLQFRFTHMNGTIIDIVPFGDIENPSGQIRWPTNDAVMTAIGFEEALQCAMEVQVRKEPLLNLKICTPPALAILKLIAWDEKYPERSKDALDIDFMMRAYIDAGNDKRLYAEDTDILQEEGYDYDLASARLLGRDMAKIADADSLHLILDILERETADQSHFNLVADMNRGQASFAERFDQSRALLTQLLRGIKEPPKTAK